MYTQVAEHLSWLEESAVRSKLLPLLMQWDLCHPNQVKTSLISCGVDSILQTATWNELAWPAYLGSCKCCIDDTCLPG